ncbi:carbohydrate ABC transporter membrane protein 1, CUT1 family [Streptomyces sp. DvalAA-14]|uniref:carbohydrate ABC transporter permease n=1 Tax=unclassified Streptomyces TaxID=2593676 RepID=UPI00081BBE7B|nr:MULTISPECIES: sugar ABC transporter permease [unclassified Streptomyces]MYS21159.1 ABC transporter permease subunit [Streptomyces sp. SID4948]SCD85588.1 carbohydrate ABC transporter membrane protein 1, CUT1 family [Streptomyces sp. DvalAA-14]
MAATTVPENLTKRHAGRPSGPAGGPARGGFSRKVRQNLQAQGFLIGAVLCFLMFSWYPMVREFIMSFQEKKRGETHWVGWKNIDRVYHDPYFWTAWKNTAEFTGMALVIGFAVPFVIAIVLNELKHAQAYLRILVYLPVMLPPVAGVLLFKYFYNPDYGLFDSILKHLHLPTSQFLDSSSTAMISVVVAATWLNLGSATLIYLAALQNIPGELYEAADLDGAGLFSKIWHVTIPQTRMVLSLMLLLQIVATMQEFTNVFLLTGGNGPENSTMTVVYMVYQYGFRYNNLGSAAALGLFLLVVLGIFSGIYTRVSRNADSD